MLDRRQLHLELEEITGTQEGSDNRHSPRSNTSSPKSLHSENTLPISMHRRFRDRLLELIDNPGSSIVAKIYYAFIAALVVSTIVIMILDSYETFEHSTILIAIEGTVTGVLMLELVVRFYASVHSPRDALNFITNVTNICDFLSCLPFFILILFNNILGIPELGALRVLRLLRLLRVVKISKRMRTLIESFRKSSSVILSILFYILIAVLVFATLEYYFERGVYDKTENVWKRYDGTISPFSSIPASMWWAILTLLAVGYGDVVPITPLGKFIAAMTMVVGVMVIAMPSMVIESLVFLIYVLDSR